jgi:hypothetical protein
MADVDVNTIILNGGVMTPTRTASPHAPLSAEMRCGRDRDAVGYGRLSRIGCPWFRVDGTSERVSRRKFVRLSYCITARRISSSPQYMVAVVACGKSVQQLIGYVGVCRVDGGDCKVLA